MRDRRAVAWVSRLRPTPSQRSAAAAFVLCAVAAAVVALPIALERAVEEVNFEDDLGTFPVEVGLCHDGRSTLDTGLFGKIFWSQTGTLGFGAYARATGPPEAGGTLASYVDPNFIQANVSLINDPDEVVHAYSAQLSRGLREHVARDELFAALLGGAVLFLIVPRHRLARVSGARRAVAALVLVGAATGVSAVAATQLFHAWPCSSPTGNSYTISGVDHLSFGSPETREVAEQVKPFIDKNRQRIETDAKAYEDTARRTFARQLERRSASLPPRKGETIVLAEADPQGSFVGVDVRKALYADLVAALGRKAISLRTIAGDVSSNGTVAESSYISDESKVSGTIPTVALGGDHDSVKTWQQMENDGIVVPDLGEATVAGLQVAGANDREHKTLFGGLITNTAGISEQQLGGQLRDRLDDKPRIVVLHQPDAVTGYLGLDVAEVRALDGSRTVPHDDGIPDLPPGIVDYGHWHRLDGPWVVWNTDSAEITWTVVDQLGTAGGVESSPTFSRFSTPFSVPLRVLNVRLQYVDVESGLETGYASIGCDLDGACRITNRVDVGLPGGKPLPVEVNPGR
jgi:hypothetical protein